MSDDLLARHRAVTRAVPDAMPSAGGLAGGGATGGVAATERRGLLVELLDAP